MKRRFNNADELYKAVKGIPEAVTFFSHFKSIYRDKKVKGATFVSGLAQNGHANETVAALKPLCIDCWKGPNNVVYVRIDASAGTVSELGVLCTSDGIVLPADTGAGQMAMM